MRAIRNSLMRDPPRTNPNLNQPKILWYASYMCTCTMYICVHLYLYQIYVHSQQSSAGPSRNKSKPKLIQNTCVRPLYVYMHLVWPYVSVAVLYMYLWMFPLYVSFEYLLCDVYSTLRRERERKREKERERERKEDSCDMIDMCLSVYLACKYICKYIYIYIYICV